MPLSLYSFYPCLSTPLKRNVILNKISAGTNQMYRGIGLETTILFAREGASVLMADISRPALDKAISKVQEILPNIAGKLDTITCDVSKESDVAKMVEHVDSWGGCDIIFNNAGIMHADDAGTLLRPFLFLSLR